MKFIALRDTNTIRTRNSASMIKSSIYTRCVCEISYAFVLSVQLLLALARGNRSESLGVDTHLALADAQALYRAGEARLGTNEDTFIHILTTRSAAHLNCTFQYYLQTYGHSFEKVSLKPYYYDVNNANIIFYSK